MPDESLSLDQILSLLNSMSDSIQLTNSILLFFVACASGLFVLMVLYKFFKLFY